MVLLKSEAEAFLVEAEAVEAEAPFQFWKRKRKRLKFAASDTPVLNIKMAKRDPRRALMVLQPCRNAF